MALFKVNPHQDIITRCKVYALNPDVDLWHFISDGRLNHVNNSLTRDYCFEYQYNQDLTERNDVVLRCPHKFFKLEPKKQNRLTIYTAFASLSLLFLLLTFLVYCFLPDFKNLHGKIVLMNIASIVCVMVFLLGIFNSKTNINLTLCTVIGYFGYFSHIAMFSWMTVMSVDLGWTFSRSETPRRSTDKSKLLLYSVLAWGLPVLLTITLATLQAILPPDQALNPGIGTKKCFLSWKTGAQPLYFYYIPVLLLMIANSTNFIIVVVFIVRSKRKSSVARKSSHR